MANHGKYRGKVINNVDPLLEGRIIALVPAISDGTAIAIIDQSIGNGWRGLFPLKDGPAGTGGQTPAGRAAQRRAEQAQREHPEDLAAKAEQF